MIVVVDTQAVVWLTGESWHLSEPAARLLAEGRTEGSLAIADITLRELAVLVAKKRITVGAPLEGYLAFVESVFKVLPITAQIAERSVRFGGRYPKDPADRLIGATAIVHGGRLVTKDEGIRNSGEVNCVW